MKGTKILSVLVLLGLLLAACAPVGASPQTTAPAQETPAPQPTNVPTTEDLPEAVQKARQALASQLGVDPSAVEVHAFERAQWPDSCLGLPEADESCAEVITPGYGGLLIANEIQYEFRTDESGNSVRFIPGAVLGARQVLAQQLHLDLNEITIVSYEQVDWPDACLGVEVEGMACAEVVTPGYRVVLEAGGQRYEYHTDETGGTLLLSSAPEPNIQDPAMIWQNEEGVCETAQIGSQAVAFGPCNGAMMTGKFASEQRAEDLSTFVNTYASFEAETKAGKVTFKGQGTRQAAPAEQRMIAEWAHLVFVEAAGGRSGASYGLALAWHREGGIAGFCDDLAVYVTGEATATSCKGGQPEDLRRSRLAASQLEQLYSWIDTLKPFEIDQTDPATADAMTIRLVFSGEGDKEATDAEKQAIQDFAAGLYAQFQQSSTPEGTPSSSLDQARQALEDYFAALKQGDYAQAINFYGGSYDVLTGYNPDIPETDHVALLEAGCRYSGLRCDLQIKDILEEQQVSPEEFKFTVEFANPDGSRFEQGPCCAEPTSTPPVTQFNYTVVKNGDQFQVQELPVYVP